MRVAVIGAGAAGLVTAHELGVEGHRVTVFEQSRLLGGLWNYTDAVEDDPLGQRPSRRVHGSLYASMRVNLPRDLMAFDGYTFDDAGGGRDDWPRYPHHARVLEYLNRFAADTGVGDLVRLGHPVRKVVRGDGWLVDGERFDAVAVCNGHFSEPRVPELPGLAEFPGSRCTATTIGVRMPWRENASWCSARRYRAAICPASWQKSPRCSSRAGCS